MIKRLISIITLLLASTSQVVALTLPKVYDVDYRENQTFYMYAGGKATIRFNDIPDSVDIVQLTVANRKKGPKAYTLGRRNKAVIHSSAVSSTVNFNLEIPELDSPHGTTGSIELRLKGFSKNENDSYDVVSNFSNYVRPMVCPDKDDPVCAIIKVRCRPNERNCTDGEQPYTFKSECEMKKAGGEFYHAGSCQE